jgi:hypothetical protein
MNELTLLNYMVGSASLKFFTTAVVIMSRSLSSGVQLPVETPVICGENLWLDPVRARTFSETRSRRARTSLAELLTPAVPRYQPRTSQSFHRARTLR